MELPPAVLVSGGKVMVTRDCGRCGVGTGGLGMGVDRLLSFRGIDGM